MRNVVIYIGAFELPDKNAAAQRVLANAAVLRKLGYEVVLIGRNADQPYSRTSVTQVDYPSVPYTCWEIGNPQSRSDWLHYISSCQAVKSVIEDGYKDRLHSIVCYNFPAVSQLRLKTFANHLGAKGVADVTEWYQRLYMRSPAAVIKNMDTSFRMRIANFRMDGLITTSRYLTRFYSRKFDDLVELPTLIDVDPTTLTPMASPDGAPKKLIFTGGLQDKRSLAKEVGGLKDRLNWIVELLAEIENPQNKFQLDVFGVGDQEYRDYFPEHRGILEKLGSSIVFHGRQPRALLLESLKAADFSIFMRPDIVTTIAGFPTKFSESVSYGTPVLTNALDCLIPYIREGQNCFTLDRADMTGSVKTLNHALGLSQSDILLLKQHCLNHRMFHPDSFCDPTQALFPKVEGSY